VSESSARAWSGLPRGVLVLSAAAAAVIVTIGARQLGWLLAPMLLAMVLVILVHPVHAALLQRRVPWLLATTGLLLAVFGIVAAVLGLIVFAMARLATLLSGYVAQWRETSDGLADWLESLGIGPEQAGALVGSLDVAGLAPWLTSQLPSALGLASSVVFFVSLLIFMTIESTHAGLRFRRLGLDHPRVGESLRTFVSHTRRFYGVVGAFAVLVGVLDTIFLAIIGIPLAWLWGVLAAVCNFIPYVGFVIGMVPPALLALLVGDWKLMLLVIVVYFVLNSLITTLLPAKIVGDAVSLSMAVGVISVGFWTWVLGPLGAILAVPMTLLVKALLADSDPQARWLQNLLTSGRDLREDVAAPAP